MGMSRGLGVCYVEILTQRSEARTSEGHRDQILLMAAGRLRPSVRRGAWTFCLWASLGEESERNRSDDGGAVHQAALR